MSNIVWHKHAVDKQSRAELKGQKPLVIWFTGLSGAGKSTLAGALEQALAAQGKHTYLLDGDNVRHGLCGDLGFDDAARQENIRRVGEVAKLMVDAGLIVLTALSRHFVPSASWCAASWGKGSLSRCLSMRRLPSVKSVTPRGSIKKRGQGKFATLPVSIRPMRPPSSRRSFCLMPVNRWMCWWRSLLAALRLRGLID